MKELRSFTGLRFLIALWVFLFHLQIRWPIVDRPFFVNILNQGAVGMSFFFMLSGFILSYSYQGSLIPRSYIRARFARIYPIYIFAGLLALPWLGINWANGGG